MIQTRALEQNDIEKLRWIHEKYYSDQFLFPDFLQGFLCAFVMVNSDNEIVSAGGLRPIVESIIITNKDMPVREKREALYQVLDVTAFVAGKNGYDQITCFVQENKWERHLKKIGFSVCKGTAL